LGETTAAIEIDGAASNKAREDDTAIESVLALMDESGFDQQVLRISQLRHVAAEYSPWSIADGELLDQARILHASVVKVLQRLGMSCELLPVEVDGFSQRVIWSGVG
jgi:hypothetical protein